jgi:hypothetical protein
METSMVSDGSGNYGDEIASAAVKSEDKNNSLNYSFLEGSFEQDDVNS